MAGNLLAGRKDLNRPLPQLGLLVPMGEILHPKTGRPTNRAVAAGGPLQLYSRLKDKLASFPEKAPILIMVPGGYDPRDGSLQLFHQMLRGWTSVEDYCSEIDAWREFNHKMSADGHDVLYHVGSPRTCKSRTAFDQSLDFILGASGASFDATAQSSADDTDGGQDDVRTMQLYQDSGYLTMTEGWIGRRSPFWSDPTTLCHVTTENFRGIWQRQDWRDLKPVDEWNYTTDSPWHRVVGSLIDSKWDDLVALQTTIEMLSRGCTVFMDVYDNGPNIGKTFPGMTPSQILQQAMRQRL